MNKNNQMQDYYDLSAEVMQRGTDKGDRTGTGTLSVFGAQMRFDLTQGFPMVTRKFVPFRLVRDELIWFLMGNPDITYLEERNNHIWDEWVKEDGTFGPIYGQQWRSWPSYKPTGEFRPCGAVHYQDREIDQLRQIIDQLRDDPDSRRIIVSAWNVADVQNGEMALPPCHILFQFYSRPMSMEERLALMDGVVNMETTRAILKTDEALEKWCDYCQIPRRALSCQLYQRSADLFLGVPFNIASYALLTHMVARLTNHTPEEFIWTGGDCHIYKNHLSQVKRMLNQPDHRPPKLIVDSSRDFERIEDFYEDDTVKLVDYEHGPKIPAPVAV